MNPKAVSKNKSTAGTRIFLAIFGLIFMSVGLFACWSIVLSPWINTHRAESWTETECTIVSSKLKTHPGDESSSYEPIINYEYEVNHQTLTGNQASFNSNTNEHSYADNLVKKYKAGSNSVCYFNPDDPSESVLSKELYPNFFSGLFTLIFVVAGGAIMSWGIFGWGFGKGRNTVSGNTKSPTTSASGLTASLRNSNSPGLANSNSTHPADLLDQEWSSPKKLKPEINRWHALIGVTFFAVIWNGFVGFFIYMSLKEGLGGIFDWFFFLFMIPFVLVGLLLIFGIAYTAMGLFNPVIEIAMSSGAIGLGESVDIAWEIQGDANRFKSLTVEIKGEQKSTYQQGTDTHTDREIFEVIPIVQTSQVDEMQFGSATITIPDSTMHSFKGANNEISWNVFVVGEISRWPNVSAIHPFRVKPF